VKRRYRKSLLAVVLLVASYPAFPIPIVQSGSFGTTLPLVSGASIPQIVQLDPFDASLGTLDSVGLTMQGLINLNALLPPSYGIRPPGVPFPIPNPYRMSAKQEISGSGPLASLDFFPDAELRYIGSSPGGLVGFPLIGIYSFSYSVLFTSTTDLAGFASITGGFSPAGGLPAQVVIDPAQANGTRAMFESTLPNPLIFMPRLSFSGFARSENGFPLTGSLRSQGSIILQYNYTPFEEPVPEPGVPIPEPTTLLLLGLGLAGLGFERRRLQ